MQFKFSLIYNSITYEVKEPANFDGCEFVVKKDRKLHGLIFEFTTTLDFYYEGKTLIETAYDSDNIDAQIDIIIYQRRSKFDTWQVFYNGVLNLNDIEIKADYTKVRIEQSGFSRKFRGKKDLNVAITPNKTVKLHSKKIQLKSEFKVTSDFVNLVRENIQLLTYSLGNRDDAYQIPAFADKSELTALGEINEFFTNNINANSAYGATGIPNHRLKFDFSGECILRYRIKGKFYILSPLFNSSFALYLEPYSASSFVNADALASQILHISDSINAGNLREFDFDVAGEITLNPTAGDYFWFYFRVSLLGSVTFAIQNSLEFVYDYEATYFSLEQLTEGLPSDCKGILVKDTFEAIVADYTGVANRFKSDFFTTDCGKDWLLTNGFQIRNLIDKPIYLNFQDLYDSLNSVYNLGFAIQLESGLEVVRVEPMEYFYSNQELLQIQNPTEVVRKPAIDLYVNKIEVGYETWQDESNGQINGLDEFNSNRQYSTAIQFGRFQDGDKNRKELNIKSKLITSGYLIEYTRRQIGKNSTDFKFDNNTFLISLNKADVISDKYTNPKVNTTYSAGEVSERNENFISVNNIVDKETAYNLRVSPVRNLLRWAKYVVSFLVKGNANLNLLTFRSGTGNLDLQTKIESICDKGEVSEKQNLALLLANYSPIFEAEYLSFEYPLSFTNFIALLNKPNAYITVLSGNEVWQGYLEELRFKPNEGLADWKLIKRFANTTDCDNLVAMTYQDSEEMTYQDTQNQSYQNSQDCEGESVSIVGASFQDGVQGNYQDNENEEYQDN